MKHPLIALVALIFAACANHVRFVDIEDEGRANTVAGSRVVIEPSAEVLDVERVALHFSREDRIDARERTTLTRIDEIPLSLAFNAVDGVLLGWIPNRLVDGYTYGTFAALNPFMNAESDARIEQREVGKLRKDGEAREERVSAPLRDVDVDVRLDDAAPVHLRTDSTGSLNLDLLELATAAHAPAHELTIAIAAGSDARPALSRSLYIGRELSERLDAASVQLRTLNQSSASASALAEAVQMLDAPSVPVRP